MRVPEQAARRPVGGAGACAAALTWRGTLNRGLGICEPVEHGLVVPQEPARLHALRVLLPGSLRSHRGGARCAALLGARR